MYDGAMKRGVGWAVCILAVGLGCEGESAAGSEPACAACHKEHVRFWQHGGHREIACTDCHGAQPGHLWEEADPRPEMDRRGPEHCLSCHQGEEEGEGLIVGFEEHLIFVEKRHATEIDRDKVGKKCTSCHDPHLLE